MVQNGRGIFFPPGYDPPAPQKGLKTQKFRRKNRFSPKSSKIIEFDLFDGLESCASEFRAYSTKNQIFRPSGCRD